MKKAFIGLLVVAAGAAAYFFLQEKRKKNSGQYTEQELIIGKWKLDSIHLPPHSRDSFIVGLISMIDTNFTNYEYDFKKNGDVDLFLRDSLTNDSVRYEWNNKGELIWKEFPGDPKGEAFKVSILRHDSMYLQTKGSSVLVFSKLKK